MASLASSAAAPGGGLSSFTGAGELPAGHPAALLATLPWGVLAVAPSGIITYLNAAAATLWGVPAAAIVGRAPAQVQPAVLPPGLLDALARPDAAPAAYWLPHTQQWVSQRPAPAPDGQRWLFWENTTAQHQAEAARQRSTQLLLDMEEVAQTGSYEADLLTGSFYFSDGLYRLFGEAPRAFEVTLAVIDARSHPDDAATVRQVLDEAVRTRQPYTYRRRIRRADGAWRTLEAHGAVRCDAAGQPVQLRGLVQDITERVQAEQAQQASHELLQRTIDSSLDLVQVFEAVRDEQGAVVDFTWVLNNDAAEQVYGDVIGQRLCERNPGVVPEGIFDTFKQVLETGVPDQREYHYVHEQFNGWFYQSTVKQGDGVATTTHDISARKQAEQELRETKELLQATLDSSHHVVQVLKAVRDEQGTIIDFTWVLTNQVWLKQYGGPMTGKRLLQENPGVVETGLFQLFVQVTETDEPVDHEQYYAHEQFKAAWFHQTLVRMGDGFVMNTIDITERKRAQEEIINLKEELAQQATDKYHALFQRMNQGFCVLEILFDATGQQAVGFNPLEVNPQFARESGMAAYAAGDTLRELVPALDDFWLAAYGQVVRTGEAQRLERYESQVSRWFEVHTFRIGPPAANQVAVLFTDTTARKQAEQHQQYVMRLADALRPLADPLAIQREALAVLRAHLGSARTLYAEALDQEGTMYITTEDRDPGLVPMEGLVMRFQDYTPDGLAEAQAGRPLWRSDVLNEPHTPEQLAGCATFGTRAWLMVPLVKNRRLVADLTVHSATARAWTAHDIALVQETTERTWAAVERARAEEALRESEAQFRAVANLGPDLLWRSSPDNETTWYNQRWLEYTGQTLAEAAGDGWKNVIHPDDQTESSRRYQAAIATGQLLRLEHRIRSAQGEYRWFQVRAKPLRNEHGTVTAWYGAATDIHARKLAELRLRRDAEADAFRVHLHEVLRPLADAAEIQEATARLLREWLGAGWCYYNEFDDTGTVATVVRDAVRPGLPLFVGVRDLSGVPGYLAHLRAGHVFNAPDITAAGLFSPAAIEHYMALGVRAAVGVPLVKAGRLLAVLMVADTVVREWSADAVAMLQEVAERTWATGERARTATALRESEEKLRTVFESIDEAFCLIDIVRDATGAGVDYRLLEANGVFERQTGVANARGKLASEYVPDEEAYWLEQFDRVARTGEPVRLENYHQATQHWYSAFATRIGGPGSHRVAIVFTDITGRKQAELRQQFMLQLSDALRTEPDADAVAHRALTVLAEQLGADRCYVGLYHLAEDQATFPYQVGNHRVPPLPAAVRLSDFPAALRVTYDGSLVIDDLRQAAGLSDADRQNLGALGFGALVVAPLRRGPAGPQWAIIAVSATARHWTAGEVALLEEATERTWAALERARAEEALRASEATLAAVFDALPVGIGLADAHGRLTLTNHQMQRYLPTSTIPSRDETQRRRWHAERPDGSPLPPTEFPGARAQRGEKVVPGIEMLHTPAGGPPVWTQVFAVPLQYRHGQVAGHVTVILDIDARKRTERQQTFLLKLSDALRPLTSPAAIQAAAAALLGEHLGVARAYYADLNYDTQELVVARDWYRPGAPSHARRYPLGDWPMPWLLNGQTWVCRDVDTDPTLPDAQRPDYRANDIRAAVVVPLLKQGRLAATLVVNQNTPHAWTPPQVALVEETAQRTWAAVERAKIEEALRVSEEKYRRIFEDIDQGFSLHELIVDENDQVSDVILQEVNAAFEQHTGIRNAQGKTISELVPTLEPVWLEAMTRAYKLGETQRFEAYNADTNRWITSQYSRLGGAGSRLLSTVFTDITERKQREQHQEFLLKLSDALRPGADSAALERAALQVLGETLGADRVFLATVQADGTSWSVREEYAAGLPGSTGTYPLAEFQLKRLPQWRAGHMSSVADSETDPTLSAADRAAYAAFGLRAAIGVPLVKGGRFTALLCVNQVKPRRWTTAELALTREAAERIWVALERARAEEALAASEQRLRALIANLPGAAAFVVGPDLRYQLAGGEALDAAGLGPADLLGRTVAEAMPPDLVAQYETYYRQALAGQDFSLEHAAHGRTFVSRGVPLLGAAGQPEAVLVVSYDISARKQAEEALRTSEAQLAELNAQLELRVARRTQQLQASRDLLQSVLDTSLISMSVLRAVRDEAGQVQDFRLALVNKKLERETGRTDLVGKLYAQEYPGVRQVGIFDLMLRALATNEPQTLEYFYDHEGFHHWYTCQFVKMGDGLVATNLDITERKAAEQERLKNLRLLEQAEAVAGLGSWDYDLASGHMRWSDGMYQLVGLPRGQPVSPDVYLHFVVDDDRPRAEHLVRQLRAGQSAEQTLRLRVGEQLKTVHLKAVVLRDAAGLPARVLGVDLDISELQRLEADNLRLRLGQQQALFEAVQEAQETERTRMAESLHNGIGQILFATKLRLDRLHTPLLGTAPDLVTARGEADQLLGEAIRQTRALSHELVPTTLKEFGLVAAIQDICRKMSTPQLRLRCQVALDHADAPLPAALQLALYRMTQELAQNIVKHARGATEASLELETMPGWVLLRAEDNGPGFDPAAAPSPGLGLRSIRDRVALLGGRLEIGSASVGGAYVRIKIPIPSPSAP